MIISKFAKDGKLRCKRWSFRARFTVFYDVIYRLLQSRYKNDIIQDAFNRAKGDEQTAVNNCLTCVKVNYMATKKEFEK